MSNGGYRGAGMGSGLTDGVKYLLIWNAILYLLQHYVLSGGISFLRATYPVTLRVHGVLQVYPYEVGSVESLFGIVPALVWQKGFVWQLFTYMFLHGNLFHILFNMFALWMFGCDLERLWGTRRFIGFYVFTGAGAALLTVLLTPHGFAPTIGASGAIYGILLGYARFFPERRVLFYFLFPIPVRVFVLIIGVIALLNSISQPGDEIAHMTHLGGLLFAWIYLKGLDPGNLLRNWRWRRRRNKLRMIDFTRNNDSWGGGAPRG